MLMSLIWFAPAILTGCGQPPEMSALKEKIESAKSANTAKVLEITQWTQKLDLLRRQIREDAGKVMEFEKLGKQSSATEEMLTKYRKDLEGQLKAYQDEIAAYRKAYLKS